MPLQDAPAQSTQATTIPLILPSGIAYDAQGNLFIAESRANRIVRVTPAGVLTTFAGTGEQGFSGDGGSALSALLDSPTGVAVSTAGDLFVADTHNHRIRKIAAQTGIITTVAGVGSPGPGASSVSAAMLLHSPTYLALDTQQNIFFADSQDHLIRRIDGNTGLLTTVAGSGTQGFSGDGGPALKAALDSPSGLAVDGAGNIFLADSHNHRVRRIDAVSGTIQTTVGSGTPGFSGDQTTATSAQLHLPQGLSLDSAGNLLVADRANHRIRRIDAVTGNITTFAGDGTQAFAGDGALAVTASLDSPAAVTLSPSDRPTLADSGNLRVRQIDAASIIRTIAGIGGSTPGALTLSGPSTLAYGSGTITAHLVTSPATGSVTFFDLDAPTPTTLLNAPLAANAAILNTAALPAGYHQLSATYAGDSSHSSAQSPVFALQISPLALTAAPNPLATVYGQQVPTLTATLTGLLPQDTSLVTLNLGSSATASSPPGAYPILATLAGPSAPNYELTEASASVTISKAPASLTLNPVAFTAQATSSTIGTPSGAVALFDGSTQIASAPLDRSGTATFPQPSLTTGSHTLVATYAGDADFLASTSSPAQVNISPVSAADFVLSATGQTSISIPSGSSATYSFAVAPSNGALASAIQLTVAGLPTGATATFNPAYLPPSATNTAFLLTVKSVKLTAQNSNADYSGAIMLALLIPSGVALRKRPAALVIACLTVCLLTLTACGDRINQAAVSASSRSYNLTVIATATSATGTVLQHTANVTLVLQ